MNLISRVCKMCGEKQPLSNFYKTHHICGHCRSEVARKNTQRKKCTQCNEYLTADMYSICSKNKDGLQSKCRACHTKLTAEWRRNNPGKDAQLRKKYRVDTKVIAVDRVIHAALRSIRLKHEMRSNAAVIEWMIMRGQRDGWIEMESA